MRLINVNHETVVYFSSLYSGDDLLTLSTE